MAVARTNAESEHQKTAEYYRQQGMLWDGVAASLTGAAASIATSKGPAAGGAVVALGAAAIGAEAAATYCKEQQREAERKAAAEKAEAEKAAAEKAAAEKAAAEKAAAAKEAEARAAETERQIIDQFRGDRPGRDYGGRESAHDPGLGDRISRTC